MLELKTTVENSNESNSNAQRKLTEAQASIRILEDDKVHLTSRLTQKDKEIEDLTEDIRRLRRQNEVWTG